MARFWRNLRSSTDPGLVQTAVCNHAGNLAEVGDVRERIAVHQDEVGTLAGFDRARIGLELHGTGGDNGGGLNGFERGHAGLHVDLELAQQPVAGKAGIAAGHDGNPGLVQRADHGLRLAIRARKRAASPRN